MEDFGVVYGASFCITSLTARVNLDPLRQLHNVTFLLLRSSVQDP